MGGLFDSTAVGSILKNKKKSGQKKGARIAEAGFAKERAASSAALGAARSENATLLNTLKEEERTSLL